ncbi:macro domain-containing protein [Gimesia maris]|uniref:macro domain-containing protein n=1 Tax=Gimesia maris TaxID=122 RepID=UPI0030DC3498
MKRTVAMSPVPLQKKLRLQIRLTAIDERLYQAWQRWCGDLSFVKVHHGSIFDAPADAIVSPANSFGFMDGGIDRLYLERLGLSIQDRVQNQIRENHGGELLVGAATMVETEDSEFPFLIAAPTMRVPMPVEDSINAFLAARAIFLLIRDGVIPSGENVGQPVREYVNSITVPGLATGVGRMSPVQCAKQVRAAIEDVLLDRFQFPANTSQIRKRHDRLLGK